MPDSLKSELNPKLIIHGVEADRLIINPPMIHDSTFSILINLPEKYTYHDFQFIPYGNRYVIMFQGVEIHSHVLDQWICPESIKARYEGNGHTLYIEGKIVTYHFTVSESPPIH